MMKACKNDRYLSSEKACPLCGATGPTYLTKRFEGEIIVINPNSEVAKAIGAKVPGKYALKIK